MDVAIPEFVSGREREQQDIARGHGASLASPDLDGAAAFSNEVKYADMPKVRERRAGVELIGADDAERFREPGIEKYGSCQPHGPQRLGKDVVAAPR